MNTTESYSATLAISFSNAPVSITNLLFSALTRDLENDIKEKGYMVAFYKALAYRNTYGELNEFVRARLATYGTVEANTDFADQHLKELYDLEDFQVKDIRRMIEDYVLDILQQATVYL